jgi:hypothetical protein
VELLPGIDPAHAWPRPGIRALSCRAPGRRRFTWGSVPTSAHLPLVYIMGYDLEPLRTLESKRALFREAWQGTGSSFSS